MQSTLAKDKKELASASKPTQELSGWGRYPRSNATITRAEKITALASAVESCGQGGLLARGAGLSYGDAAQNDGGELVFTERLNRLLSFNQESGTVCLESGVTIGELLEVFIPRGYFVPVVPGTQFVTTGGAIAADIHGKNHHKDGSFSQFVNKIKLITADGKTIDCSRDYESDVFYATAGGMGLTGIVSELELALRKIETSYINYRSIKAGNLSSLIELFDQHESNYQYSVAWIDCLAEGKDLGRGVLMLGNHAGVDELPQELRANPLAVQKNKQTAVPFDMPSGLLNRLSMGAFNNLFYLVKNNQETIVDYKSFFFPLDALGAWNRCYGKAGFIQYQCVFPEAQSREALTAMLKACATRGQGSFLAVLKRFGANALSDQPSLSFPMPGFTLTLDFPVKDGLMEFVAELDKLVVRFGGRIYFAKDACSSPDIIPSMYPSLPAWQKVKKKLDPENIFQSSLSRRLNLI